MEYSTIYCTTANADQAKAIGRRLVEERLAACANCIDSIHSVYWWEGEIEESGEAAFFAKTRTDLVPRCIERIRQLHTYDVPCVVSWKIDKGNPAFLQWIDDSTASP